MSKTITLPVDQGVRDRAQAPRESFHLEAPAGSGKTSVLLARFLTLLARVEAPEALLALTFTRKAAGELRTRVMQLLWAREEPGPHAGPLERHLRDLASQVFRRYDRGPGFEPIWSVLAPERLPIMTFHSFCSRLLRQAPQEAGAPLDYQVLENEDEVRRVRLEALEEMRRRLNARPAADPLRQVLIRRLVRLNNNWPRLAAEMQELLSRRDGWEEFLGLARASREEGAYGRLLTGRLQLLITRDLERLQAGLAATELGRRWPEFYDALRRQEAAAADTLPAGLPGIDPQDLPAWQAVAQSLLTQKGDLRRSFTPAYGYPKDFKKTSWSSLIRDLPADTAGLLHQCRDFRLAGVPGAEAEALQDLVLLLAEALRLYEEICARRRGLDFIALERAALNLLQVQDPGELLLRLDCRLQHLLVDEFQDTSQNQLTLLCRLLAGWEAEAGRTLLVVGDPKQSIYGWRQAKLRLFLESREGLPCRDAEPYPLQPLLLSTNFRTTTRLIEWVNGVFGDTIMRPDPGGGGVMFHPAEPRPGAPGGEPPHLALFTGEDRQSAREAEARFLARQVAQAAAQRRDGEKLGILLFARTHLPVYLQALSEAGLTVRVKEGLALQDSRAVQQLHNLARALVRPQDDVAWAAWLRGPWSRQPLLTLSRLAQAPGGLWLEKLRHFAAEDEAPAGLKELVEKVLAAREQVGRRPLAEIIGQWLDHTGSWPALAAGERPVGRASDSLVGRASVPADGRRPGTAAPPSPAPPPSPAEVANARAYLDLLAAAESALPEETFTKADFALGEAYQPPDPRAQDSPVELLTVHGAKGLEYDQVFLPYLDWQPLTKGGKIQTPPFLLEEIPGTRLHGLALARPYAQARHSPLYLALRRVQRRRLLDEARRVFYVAVTRARRRLVLSGVLPANKDGLKAPPHSPLGWLWQHYQPEAPARGANLWAGPELPVELFTDYQAATPVAPSPPVLPPAWDLAPEPQPYRLQFPSQLAPVDISERGPSMEDNDLPRLRGEILHALLETFSRGEPLPGEAAVAAALRRGGADPDTARRLAPELLAEVDACRRDPFIASLLSSVASESRSEWLLEDQPAPGLIRRGQMDLLAYDGQTWWILDYKTSRPADGTTWEEFIRQETEKYRPQLLAYREMAAKAKEVGQEDIRLALYFTACQRAVEL